MSMEQADLELLLSPDFLINQILNVHRYIKRFIRTNPQKAFKTYFVDTARGPKPFAAVDLLAEHLFRSALEAKFMNKVRVEGEETPAEILDHERTSLLFQAKDIEGLAKAIVRLVTDSELRIRIGVAAASEVRNMWLWPQIVKKMQNVYLEASLRDPSILASPHSNFGARVVLAT